MQGWTMYIETKKVKKKKRKKLVTGVAEPKVPKKKKLHMEMCGSIYGIV